LGWGECDCGSGDDDTSNDDDDDDNEPVDADGDGYDTSEDCDDLDSEVHPGAAELICDGVDNDCDAATLDEPAEDADGDGDPICDDCDDGDPGLNNDDLDMDGYSTCNDDCDDANSATYDMAAEICDGEDNDCDDEVPADELDDDADGVMACEGDCDDGDDEVHPFAVELCDGIDNDCDGIADGAAAVDAILWYADADGDGYGDPAITALACAQPLGHVDNADDCDDMSGAVHPGATEVCNSLDDDCDGDADSDAVDMTTWWVDGDGDGHGDSATSVLSCDQPSGYAAIGDDCDDASPDVYPGAVEYCDEVDQDCNGILDDNAVDETTWYLDGDGDGWGDPANSLIACDAPPNYVITDGDCDDTDPDTNPNTTWYVDADGDGFGDPAQNVMQCADPGTGWTRTPDDCDDSAPDVYPGAIETCSDGVDSDCDGIVDNDCPDEHCGTYTFSATWDDDPAGHLITCDIYVEGPNAPVLTIQDGAHIEFAPNTGLYIGDSDDGDIRITGYTDGVILTSNAQSPAAGDWAGLFIGTHSSTTSHIEGLTIEYGGAAGANLVLNGAAFSIINSNIRHSSTHGMLSTSSEPSIQYSEFRDNLGDGIFCANDDCLDDVQGSFSNNTVTANAGAPMVIDHRDVFALSTTSSFQGNGEAGIRVYGGVVENDTLWPGVDEPFVLQDSLMVEGNSSPVLTLLDGAELRFTPGTGLVVGDSNDGDLIVSGTANGVLLTSSESSPAAGDWNGVQLGSDVSSTTDIEGLTVEFGGGLSADGGLFAYLADSFEVRDSSFHDNNGAGIQVDRSSISIEGCDIRDNTGNGVHLFSGSELTSDFVNNTLTGNGGYPLQVGAFDVDFLQPSSSYTGNSADYIYLWGGDILNDATWQDLAVPFVVSVDMEVGGAWPAVLTIEDGVDVLFGTGAAMMVARTNDDGDLVVQGDWVNGDGVYFGAFDAQQPGSWDGITLGDNTTSVSALTGLTLEYGGGISAIDATVTVSDCVIRDAGTDAFYVHDEADVSISNCSVEGAGRWGLNVTQNNAILSVTDTSFTGCEEPVALPAMYILSLDPSCTFTGNLYDRIHVWGGTIDTTQTWLNMGVAYYIGSSVNVGDAVNAPVLTIEPNEVQCNDYQGLRVGNNDPGDLIADGVTFTSWRPAQPSPGDWSNLVFGEYTSSLSSVEDAIIEYGGGGWGYGAVYCDDCSLSLDRSTIRDSATWGLYYAGVSPSVSLVNTVFTNNALGDTN